MVTYDMDGDLWRRWHEHYQRTGLESRVGDITTDGIIDEGTYRKADTRVLFVLRESNDFGGGDLRTFLADNLKFQMWHTIARWAAGIQCGFPDFEEIDKHDTLLEALRSSAAINLKKVTGGAAADLDVINAFAHHDRELLIEQILAIKPDVIVACGTFDTLIWLLDLPCDPVAPHDCAVVDPKHGWRVVAMRHPAMCDNKKTYDRLRVLLSKTQ